MTDQDPIKDAYVAIGRFFSTFSELDYELGETVKVIFRITDHDAADAIVALADFAKKVNLIRSAVQFAKRPDGEDLSETWKEKADEILKQVHTINNGDR